MRIAGFSVGVLCLALAGCAGNDPARLTYQDGSARSLLIVELDPPVAGSRLEVATYDEQAHAVTAYIGAGDAAGFEPGEKTRYAFAVVDPGTYAFVSVAQQVKWAVCFHEKSLAFTVSAGQSVFLGRINMGAHLAQLQQSAVTSHQTYAKGVDVFHYFDNILPPQIAEPDAAAVAKAQQFVSQRMPQVKAELKPASYRPAHFGTGYDAFHVQRICTGYYRKTVK
jgi:hypothetical protein